MTHDPYRSISGEVLYLHDEKGLIGHEEFTITQDGSSHRTLRARCEIYEEGLLRDVTYTVDQNWIPQDAFVRLSINKIFKGSSWFRFAGDVVECESFTMESGRTSQKQTLNGPIQSFAAHPLSNDAWGCANFDMSESSKKNTLSMLLQHLKLLMGILGQALC